MKGIICGMSYESQYAFLEKRQTLRISYIGISKFFHSIIVERKKEFLKYSHV